MGNVSLSSGCSILANSIGPGQVLRGMATNLLTTVVVTIHDNSLVERAQCSNRPNHVFAKEELGAMGYLGKSLACTVLC